MELSVMLMTDERPALCLHVFTGHPVEEEHRPYRKNNTYWTFGWNLNSNYGYFIFI